MEGWLQRGRCIYRCQFPVSVLHSYFCPGLVLGPWIVSAVATSPEPGEGGLVKAPLCCTLTFSPLSLPPPPSQGCRLPPPHSCGHGLFITVCILGAKGKSFSAVVIATSGPPPHSTWAIGIFCIHDSSMLKMIEGGGVI